MKLIKKNKIPFLVLLTYSALLIFKTEIAFKAFDNSSYYLFEMFQILPVIFMLAVAIDVLIPKEWIMKRLGNNSGISGGVLALIFGSISAGPIYAAFPITKMLHKKGASVNNIVIILSAWAVIKVPMLANEAKFLGIDFMIVRWVLTVISILFMGWFMNKLKIEIKGNEEKVENNLYINEDYCIGCGVCHNIAPKLYHMKDGKAYIEKPISDIYNYQDVSIHVITQTVEKCPSKAIIIKNMKETI